MEALSESVRLMDWWIRGTHPDIYTHSGSAGIHFDLDTFLWYPDGQGAKLDDVAEFYADAVREIATAKPVGFIAVIHPQDDFDRLGIIPLAGIISRKGLAIPYVLVEPKNSYHPIKTGGIDQKDYLQGCGTVMVTDSVTSAGEIISVARILRSYGAGEVSGAVSLVAARETADFLQTQNIDLLFSHEVKIEDGVLKFNPNQRLLALTS